MPIWTSGGRSITALTGAGWFSFSVPAGVGGVVAGLNRNDLSADPSEIECGFFFGAGSVRIIEGGVYRTAPVAYSSGDVFYVVRSATGVVYYCRTGAAPEVPGLSFTLPGELLYTSGPAYGGDAYLDASLLSIGDEVVDAAIYSMSADAPDGTTSGMHFEPLVLAASEGEYISAVLSFLPLTLSAQAIEESGAILNFRPLVLAASEGEYISAVLEFEPLTLSAVEGTVVLLDGAELQFQPLTTYITMGGLDTADAELAFPIMHARGAEVDLAEVDIVMPELFAYAYMPGRVAPYFAFSLPSIGNWDMIPDVEDIVEVSEQTFTGTFRLVTDTAEVLDETDATSITSSILEDLFFAEDVVVQGSGQSIEDIFEAEDEVPYFGNHLLVVDEFSAGEELTTAGTSVSFVEDTAEVLDETALNHLWVLEDTAEVLDETAISAYASVEDTAEVLEEVYGTGHTQLLVEDVVEVLEELAFTSGGAQLVEDAAHVDDEVFKYDAGLMAWVMNTESGGVSWYENWAFTGMAVGTGGKVFAVGPEGLSVLGGDTDAGSKIAASVGFGFTDFSGFNREGGANNTGYQKKRVDGYWLGYTSDGVLGVDVETYGQGFPPYPYKMAPRRADSPRNGRIIPGKGLNARYWRLTLTNFDGCDFEVSNLSADIAQSARRL